MWKRDHGGYDAKHMSRPLWRMPPGSSIRIPAFAGDMRVRLYFSAYGFDERAAELAAALPSSLAGIRFRVGSAVLAPRLILMRPVERRKAARAVDFALDLPVPAAAAAGADPDLAIDFRPLQEWDMLLYQVEFIAGSAQDGLPPPDGPPSVAWRAGDSRDTWGPGGRLDGEFRALAGPATVRVDAAEGALLFFYWPSRSASGQCSLSLTAGTNTTELALKPSDRPVEHLVRFSGGAGGVVQISPAFDTQPDVWPVLNFVAPVPSPSAGAPARLTMESGRVSSLLLDGFWGPEPQPDGSVIRWTKERATVRLPVLDPSRGLRIELAAQGGPPKLGDIPVRALVNDREIGTATAVPGVAQTLVFRVPAERLVAGMNRLAIEARTWKPSERLRSDDTRSLGVALRSVQWRPDSE
jgi:hypothetical protein